MIDTGTSFFMCDECPACEGVDYRLQIAKEGGYDPQLEYCWCEKLQKNSSSVDIVKMQSVRSPKLSKRATVKLAWRTAVK